MSKDLSLNNLRYVFEIYNSEEPMNAYYPSYYEYQPEYYYPQTTDGYYPEPAEYYYPQSTECYPQYYDQNQMILMYPLEYQSY